jgi:hypothetical protein
MWLLMRTRVLNLKLISRLPSIVSLISLLISNYDIFFIVSWPVKHKVTTETPYSVLPLCNPLVQQKWNKILCKKQVIKFMVIDG